MDLGVGGGVRGSSIVEQETTMWENGKEVRKKSCLGKEKKVSLSEGSPKVG